MDYGKSAYLKVIELEKRISKSETSNNSSQKFVEFDKNNLNQNFTDQSSVSISFPNIDLKKGQEICFEIKTTLNVSVAGTFSVGINVDNSVIYAETKQASTGYDDFIIFKKFTPITDKQATLSLEFSSDQTGFTASIDDIKIIIIGISESNVSTDIEMRALKVSENKVLVSYIDLDKIYYNFADITQSTLSTDDFSLLCDAKCHCFAKTSLALSQNYNTSDIYLFRVDSSGSLYMSNWFVNQTEQLIDTSVSYVYATACPSSVEDTILISYIKNGEIYYTSLKNGNILTSKKININPSRNYTSVYAVTQNSSNFIYLIASDANNSNYILQSVVTKELANCMDTLKMSTSVALTKYVDIKVSDDKLQENISISAAINISLRTIYDNLIANQSKDTITANVNISSETYQIPSSTTVLYGVKLNKTMNNNQPLGSSWATYTDDAVNFEGAYMDFANDRFVDNGWYNRFPFNQIKPCMVKDGAVVGYLDPNDYTKYLDGTPSNNNQRSSGNVMIEVPKVYYKISSDDTYTYIQISNQTFDGACCLAHVYKGQELSKVYVDAYLTGDRNYQTYGPCSIAGLRAAPESFSLGYANMYPEIKEHRGSRCECFTYNLFTLFGCLFAIMFKSTNARTSLGLGLEKYTVNMVITGVTDQKGMCYGESSWISGNSEKGRIKLFGMEDYYGAKYTYVTGFYVDTNTDNFRIINPYDSTSGYATTDFANYPEIVVQNSDKPIDRNLKLVPIRIAGMNNVGFARANVSVDPTANASYNDCGFCSTTRYAATSTYVIGCMAMGFNTDAGVYSFNTYSTSNTTRRGFRIVYFPEEN